MRNLPIALPVFLALVLAACAAETPAPAPDLARAPTGPTPAPGSAPGDTFHWQCGELGVATHYLGHAELVELSFSGRTLVLPIAVAASGARFADDQGNEFTTRGDAASLALAGDPLRECTRSARPSPWYEAAARGIRFRAIGNEPGWLLEVGHGERPDLRAELDYGERTLELQALHPSGSGWTGETADGTAVAVDVRRGECHDGMSGTGFEAEVQLRLGDALYRGCGAWLDD
jgi:putative lipoprotein